jgi:hypothetical protein
MATRVDVGSVFQRQLVTGHGHIMTSWTEHPGTEGTTSHVTRRPRRGSAPAPNLARAQGAYWRVGNSNRKFAHIDNYVHPWLVRMASVKCVLVLDQLGQPAQPRVAPQPGRLRTGRQRPLPADACAAMNDLEGRCAGEPHPRFERWSRWPTRRTWSRGEDEKAEAQRLLPVSADQASGARHWAALSRRGNMNDWG